ncbi:aminopeptidase P N-terminal domain-containing protein [Spiribacter roseus]|uniref:Xaa-Pro aminopeptidase n=1 Tax=Spiribacter roseus TaxID=1855875 RepID=A0ABV3RZT0_9GAMM
MDATEYARRRDALMSRMGDDAIAVIAGAGECPRNRDVDYPFRQSSDFRYLTGFIEPDAVAVLAPGRAEGAFILFSRERDPLRETWEGRTIGQAAAQSDYGADAAYPIDELDAMMPGLLADRRSLVGDLGADETFDQRLIAWLGQARAQVGERAPQAVETLAPLLHAERLIKSPAEVEQMRAAARVSADAHTRLMATVEPGMMEYQVEAELLYDFRRHNGEPAYPIIAGGGANACVLHYIANQAALRDGDLLLVDAGVELAGYAADITRTLPVNGRFSAEQRAVYEVVLAAQQAALERVGPGESFNAAHQAATRVLVEGLVDLGLLTGDVEALIDSGDYRRYFMHRTGHWLGMDVHDVGPYKVDGDWRTLQPGMVVTVEPGLYIPPGSPVDTRWQGIGVRIEDDCVVTDSGHDNLTAAVPKTIEAIEAATAHDNG